MCIWASLKVQWFAQKGVIRLNSKASFPMDPEFGQIMSIKTKEVGLSGDLRTVSLADLLQLISTSGKTGMLSISRSQDAEFAPKESVSGEVQKREIYFLTGNIIYAASFGNEDELLGKLLLRKRKISKADLDKGLSLQKLSNKRLGTVFFEMGLLSKEEVVGYLEYQIHEIIYNLFGWNAGEFVFLEGALPPGDQITTQINAVNMVMEGTRRIDEWRQIQKFLPGDDVILRVVADPKIKSSQVSVNLDDLQTLVLINGERTIPEILGLSSIGEFLTSKALHNLLTLGLVEEGGKKKIQKSQKDEEELLLEIVTKLYAISYQTIEKNVTQKLGEGAKKILNSSLHLQKTYHPILGSLVTSEDFLNFGGLKSSVTRIPKRIRFHKLMGGLNALLSEYLRSVSLTLGKNLTRQIIARIKKESAQIIASEREIAKKYELEEELIRTLKQAQ